MLRWALGFNALLLATNAVAGEVQCKGKEAMLERYLGLFDNVFNGRKVEMIPEYIATDFLSHDTAPNTPRGPEAIRLLVVNMATAFPKRKLTNDLIMCSDDLVMAYQTVEGTNDGPLFGGPPTGK
ncbi:MAG: ester cyclase, partial [Rhodospirillaceae bacterium]|nr:ester cyclase [Rhodospirillaceae bacterium]